MTTEDRFTDAEDFFWEEGPIAEKQVNRRRRKRPFRGVLLAVLLAAVLAVSYLAFAVPLGWDIPFLRRTATEAHGWNLILVNSSYVIPDGYKVELVTLRNGQTVDSRIYPDLQEMFDDMRSQGIYPVVASGYRTEEKQRQLLNAEIQEQEAKGLSWWNARREALRWVSKPGASEHQLGIAVDINQEGTKSTAKQVYDWLHGNAYRYGFIYRYPADKVHITGVNNEPWHYRYVGKEAAKEIYEKGLCLEEYLEQRYVERKFLFFS